ncbi:MAG TPA: cupin domain-containing protein [Acidimicrobiales bacterium]|jgi:mannose-6-phosphate isomerase-like protein (cupin superfamily)|nr:cupin domain-containing protein [Acidimicrobiales bacterium]
MITTDPQGRILRRPASDFLVVEPNGGERLRFLGASTMRLKVDDVPTNGAVAFYEYLSEPGVQGPPQHVHHAHDETFYVVDGTYEFIMGDQVVEMSKGSFLFLPRGTPHTFRNAGDDLGCIVGTFNPGRFANYFRELAQIIERTGGAPDIDTWTELYGRYDTTFYDV